MSNLNFFRVMQASNFDAQSIPCNAGSVSFSGGQGYYVAQAVVLGEGIGPVTCSFQSFSVPDRFRLYWSGSTVADSLVVGDQLKTPSTYNSYTSSFSSVSNLTTYNYNYSKNEWTTGSAQSVSYNSASFPPQSADNGSFTRTVTVTGSSGILLSMTTASTSVRTGSPTRGNWGAQYGVVPDYPVLSGQNYSSSCVEGEVLLSFYKHTKFPTTFDIIIEGVPSNTGWNLNSVSCPTDSTINSSSVSDVLGVFTNLTVYHTAPTFDLRPGMKVYYDSNLTQPISSSNFIRIESGSVPTNPPSTTGSSGGMGAIGWCYGQLIDDSFITSFTVTDGTDSNSAGMITSIQCEHEV